MTIETVRADLNYMLNVLVCASESGLLNVLGWSGLLNVLEWNLLLRVRLLAA